MRSLRTALAMLYVAAGTMTLFGAFVSLRLSHPSATLPLHFSLLVVLSGLFAPFTGGLFLIAAISYWRRWSSGRIWCLALGLENLAIPFLLAWFLSSRGYASFSSTLAGSGLLLGVGAVTVFAFWRWDPASGAQAHDSTIATARPGDGTLTILNHTHIFLEFVAFFVVYTIWLHWSSRRGLPSPPFWNGLLQLILAEMAAITLHEAGHALTGIAVGQKLLAFIVGPFRWQYRQGRWKFSFNPGALFLTGGATATVPQRLHEPRWRELCMIAAGPLFSLIAGGIALRVSFLIMNTSSARSWFAFAMFGSLSLLSALINCIPLRTGGLYSDGARILHILRGGVWSESHALFRIAFATCATPLRPRDYDLDALHRVRSAGIVTGLQQFLLCLFAHSLCLDRGLIEKARIEMKEAERIYDRNSTVIPAELLAPFVVDEALVARDPARARLWWDRMEAKKPRALTADHWMAKCALDWAEGNRAEAETAWAKADEYLRGMPRAGAYEFDRDRLTELKAAIVSEPTVPASPAPA